MLNNRDIICIASANWDAMWVNSQHLTSRLARQNRILYVNNLGLRAPGASVTDLRKVVARVAGWLKGAESVAPNIYVLSPIALPFHQFPLIRTINRVLLVRRIRKWAKVLGFKRPILWSFLPTAESLVGRLGESGVVYQCVDDYSANPGVAVEAIQEAEARMEKGADLTIVTSRVLFEARKDRLEHLMYSPNVADVGHFLNSREPLPDGIAHAIKGRKVIGYHGNIADYKVDLDLLEAVARANPEAILLLVGPVGWGDPSTQVKRLMALPNVLMPGRADWATIPPLVKAFDVALLPMRINASTNSSFPMKFYEYMACGKPIVATQMPNIEEYRDKPELCRIATSTDEFVKFVADALADPGDEETVAARVDEAGQHDWESRIEAISERVEEALEVPEQRVALVHDWLTGMRGGEKVLEAMCEIWPHAEIFTLIYFPGKLSPTIERMKIHTSFVQFLPWLEQRYRHYLPFFPSAIEEFDLNGFDLVISSSHCVAKSVITPPTTPHISYVHTPMRYVWDLYDDYFGPERVKNPVARLALRIIANWLRGWDQRTAPRVDAYIANSRHVAKRIKAYYLREATVIHPPVDTEQFEPAEDVEDFYLIVSAFAPYKRVDLAVEAAVEGGFRLKIVGTGQDLGKIKKVAANHDNVELLGWQSDEEIRSLFARCRAFLFPGEEDFGITPVEAQAAGRPVIAFGKGGALETVVGGFVGEAIPEDATGVFFKDQTASALVEAVRFFEANMDKFNATKIREQAQPFGRERFKDEIRTFVTMAADELREAQGR
ncbi:glycosyltransferase [bacterium]|nr:glycosyltransferase [bacterium]